MCEQCEEGKEVEVMPIICGDCKEIVKRMDENSIDSIVTDPPAGIAFMNREWDRNKGGRDQWIEWMADIATECYRGKMVGLR